MNPNQMIESAKVLCASGSPDSVRATMVILKASSDLAQAQMIHIFENAQKDLIKELSRLKNKDLVTYHTEAALARVTSILSKMKGDSETMAESVVAANLIIGKLKSKFASRIKDPEQLVKAFDLQSQDKDRVEQLVNQIIGNIDHAANCAEQSIRSQVQAACVRSQMGKDYDVEIDVSFPKIETGVDSAKVVLKQQPKLTKQQQIELDKDPVKAAQKIANDAYHQIKFFKNLYVIGRREADLVRQRTLQQVAVNEAKGGGYINASNELKSNLLKDGITAFVDRSGHKWTLGNYCKMTVRTTSQQTANLGELFEDPEHDLYIIVDRHSTCPICAKYEGRVYSRSGTNPNYPPLQDAFNKIDPNRPDTLENTYLCIHPNCRHTLAKWVERAHSPLEIEAMRNKSNPLTNPYNLDQRTENEIKRYKERERVMRLQAGAKRKYREMLQYIPVKDLGTFQTFLKHYLKKDKKYELVRKKFHEIVKIQEKE